MIDVRCVGNKKGCWLGSFFDIVGGVCDLCYLVLCIVVSVCVMLMYLVMFMFFVWCVRLKLSVLKLIVLW